MIRNPDWWRGAVIYQVYPRSFYDSNGDGIGDLPGVTAKLDYIASLNVDAIWLSPFFTSPMKDFGYDVSDYRNVDPIFGTLSDLDKLIAQAHKRGLKIMIDQVLSHSSVTTNTHITCLLTAVRHAPTRGPTGMSGQAPNRIAPRPITGCRYSAVRPGPETAVASSITCTISWPASQT